MTSYINGFLLPTLHKLKRENKLTPNQKKTILFKRTTWNYRGDLMNGKATGWGSMKKDGIILSGTFLNDQVEGIAIFSMQNIRVGFVIGQYYQGIEHGKFTRYTGSISNNIYDKGDLIEWEDIDVPPEKAYWNRDGTINAKNWN